MTIKEYLLQNKQYGNRYETDEQFVDLAQSRDFFGAMDKNAKFIEQYQLQNEEDWNLFVKQFAIASDIGDDGWRGEYFGKMMRGACMTYQYTQNEALYNCLYQAVQKLLETQDDLGRFSTYTTAYEFKGWDIWCRKYILLGLLHFHEICRDERLKEKLIAALVKHLDYIVAYIGKDKIDLSETSTFWLCINSASILEPVMKMYNITGDAKYMEFANYIVDYLTNGEPNIFTLALENKMLPYQYPVIKAYEMMSCFEGLLEYYRVTGEEKYKIATINFVDSVKKSDISIIGCAGCLHELFNHTVATQTDTDYTGIMQETCVTVTWMKLCNQLLLLTGESKYADYIETSFYNALLGAVNTNKNDGLMFDSYSPLTLGKRGRGIGGEKDISTTQIYGCCAAIGAAGTALPLLTCVTSTKKGIAVNYFEKGNVNVNGYRLAVQTEYPAGNVIKITVEEANSAANEILLRIPAFSKDNFKVLVNEETAAFGWNEGGYMSVCRDWAKGDVVEIQLDMHPRMVRPIGVEGKEKSKNFFALYYGPLVLARDAQISPVGSTVKLSNELAITQKNSADFSCMFRADVSVGEEVLDMIDYSSAGKTWDDQSLMEAWIKCE